MEVQPDVREIGFERGGALEILERLLGPADVAQDEAARNVSVGEVRIERDPLLGVA